jgi:hypothetical protein
MNCLKEKEELPAFLGSVTTATTLIDGAHADLHANGQGFVVMSDDPI